MNGVPYSFIPCGWMDTRALFGCDGTVLFSSLLALSLSRPCLFALRLALLCLFTLFAHKFVVVVDHIDMCEYVCGTFHVGKSLKKII